MKNIFFYILLTFFSFSIISCEDIDDNPVPSQLIINDFVWTGMSYYYLWQAESPDLADNRFTSQSQYNAFLDSFETPTSLFNHLRIDNAIDRFSVIYSDYTVLEGVLSGNTKNNGMDFALKYTDATNTAVIGWVRYIIPNSDAATKNVQRGDIFYAIDGIPLTNDNYRSLLASDNYTISLADYNNGSYLPNGESVSLTKTNLAENPIFLNTVITQGTHKIGYLMYNGFYASYDSQLNTVFGNFQAQQVTDLVLDLRYNSGGSIATATKLASMLTGQFSNQLFAKQQWNAKLQSYLESQNPSSLNNLFVSGLNSLNLNRVFILTTKSTASASELVINCLKPYINVVQIGEKTTGKNVGSVTLYDSPSFTKNNVNPSHRYAMQPIVLKTVNKEGFGDYSSGISPINSNIKTENIGNLGVLGSPTEPFFSAAIAQIVGSGRIMLQTQDTHIPNFEDSKSLTPLRTEMYVELK